jgi:hypothetical protein
MKSLVIASVSTLPGFVIAWFLSNYFGNEDYTFYVLIQNISIGINLALNFGLNTFMLRYKTNSLLGDAINEVKFIYLGYFILTTLITSIYYLSFYDKSIEPIYFIIPVIISSTLLLVTNNFQQFFIGQGDMNYAHIRFIASPKLVGILLLVVFYLANENFNEFSIYFYLVQLLIVIIGINLFQHSNLNKSRSIAIIKKYSYQWSTFLLHGIYSPLLIMYMYSTNKALVPTLGIAILISQPARMVYQFSIQTKIINIKEKLLGGKASGEIKPIYQNLALNSSILIFLYIGLLYIFDDLISSYLFPKIEHIFEYSLFFITYQLINALFGPNGTLLALINRSKYDTYSAMLKIAFLLVMIAMGVSVLPIILMMMVVEILVNVYKNIKLNLQINERIGIRLPLLSSLSLVVFEVVYFG